MNAASSSGRLDFQFGFGPAPQPARQKSSNGVKHLLVLGDLSGRANRGVRESLAGRRIMRVDSDNFDQVFAQHGAALNLPLAAAPGGQVTITFGSLDDFHPDHLLQRVTPLAELLAARQRLQSPATAASGAEALQRLLGTAAVAETPAAEPGAKTESSDETLARLLGKAPSPTPAQPASRPGGLDVEALVKGIVGTTSSAPPTVAGAAGLLAAADLELSTRLRAVLHHHDFQAMEAAWRGLDFLVRRCPDEERIKFFALDATLEELVGDLGGLHRLLRDQPPELIVGNYTFGATRADLGALALLAKLCAALPTTFLAGAHPQLVGCDSFALHPDPDDWKFPAPPEVREAWQALRATPEAAHLGLALPRFLLRQPYGQGSDPVDSYPFEEIPDSSAHEAFLWGNSALLCAQLRAEALAAGEEEIAMATSGEIGELPMFHYQEDGESAMKPCAEAWLMDRAADVIVQHGLIPCLSVKGRNSVQVVGASSLGAEVI